MSQLVESVEKSVNDEGGTKGTYFINIRRVSIDA